MANIFLQTGDSNPFNVSNNNSSVFDTTGATNTSVTVDAGLTGVTIASTVEDVDFSGNIANYQFQQVAGTANLNVLDGSGNVIATISNTLAARTLSFADGTVAVAYDATAGATTVGGTAASTTAGAIAPATIDAAGEEIVKTDIPITSDTTGVAGVAENFTYAIDSSSGSVLSQLSSDVTLSNFTVGEDSLTFVDVPNGTATTASFVDDVTVSSSSIENLTDIIFDENTSGDSYELVLTGIVDSDLSTVDMSVS